MNTNLRTCKIPDCDRKHYARGWCQRHYYQWWATGKPISNIRTHCKITDCKGVHLAKGWCKKHYRNWNRYGNPVTENRSRRLNDTSLPDHLTQWSKRDDNGCLVWLKGTDNGQGVVGYHYQRYRVHRLAYETAYGPIPHKYIVYQECENKRCFEPSHLTAMSRSELYALRN